MSTLAPASIYDRSNTETPCSFVSDSSFRSCTPTLAPTPEPFGLSPRPISRPSNMRPPSEGFPWEAESIPPCMSPLPGSRKQGLRLSVPGSPDEEMTGNRARASSTVSGVSATTWWSAVGSLQENVKPEELERPWSIRKIDSGIAMGGLSERRESTSSGYSSSNSVKSWETRIQRPMSSEGDTIKTRPQAPRRSSTRTTSSATGRSRPSTSHTTHPSAARNMSTSTSSTTLRPTYELPTRSRRSPGSSPTSTQGLWETPETIRRRQRRAEIGASLCQKYPNDRVHGEFLPFRSEFSHSADSLSPVRFLRSVEDVSMTVPVPASARRRNTCTGTEEPVNRVIGTAPATVASEQYCSSLLAPTTVQWKNLDSLRAEYAAVDRRKRTLWGWIRRRVLCGAGILGCSGAKEFWEEGDADAGSVRRYRLDLPEGAEHEKRAVPTPRRVRSMESTRAVVVEKTRLPDGNEERRDSAGFDRRSTMGLFDGRSVVPPATIPTPGLNTHTIHHD